MITPLLVACGSNGSGGNGGGGTIPTCTSAQALSTDGNGNFVCKDLPSGVVSLPTCDANTQAATSDSKTVTCTDRNTGGSDSASIQARLDKIESSVTTYNMQIDQAVGGRMSPNAVWVGNTPNATKGQIQHAGNPDGIIAAAATCNDAYAGSHMCTIYEMYNTAIAGKLKMTDTIAKAWIYAPAHNEPIGTPSNANLAGGGEADNCGSYTYPTADRVWTGTAVEWKILPTGGVGYVFSSGGNTTAGTSAYCHDPLPIACCK